MTRDKYPPDWKKRRHLVFKQYDRECQSCGDRVPAESETELHAHHVQPIHEGGGHELDNLLPLCGPCHRGIHSSGRKGALTPRERYTCAQCDETYIEGTGAGGSYCSEYCQYTHKAEKMLCGIEQRATICSTCFGRFPPGADVCPHCDNWDPQENNRDALGDVDLQVTALVREIIRIYNQ